MSTIVPMKGTDLLKGRSSREVRELCITCLRNWRQKNPTQRRFPMHDLANELVPLVMPRPSVPHDGLDLTQAFTTPGMESVAEFLAWFVGAGFAWPFGPENKGPGSLYLTDAGLAFIRPGREHPLLPDFVDRLVRRCPNLADDVTSLIMDARTCLEHRLMRPAIVLMGVAYEVAIEHVVDSLVARALLPAAAADARAAARIRTIKGIVDTAFPGRAPEETEVRAAVHAAYDFADQLRQRRNDASHTSPRYDFEDREEAEEFLVSAGRHLPNLWRMH